jgi:hypothetical protein
MRLHKEFEYFMRYELPIKLNLSPSKQVACEIEFEYFSDLVKTLAEKAPEEFKYFFSDFKDHVDRVARWKCPRTHEIVPKPVEYREGGTIRGYEKRAYSMKRKPTRNGLY